MNRRIKKMLLISGLIPATYLFFLTLIFIPTFITSDFTDLLFLCSSLLGIAGYIGLWRNFLLDNNSKIKKDQMYLLAGVIGYVTFLLLTRTSIHLSIGLFVFLWPTIVSIIILTNSFTEAKIHKITSTNHT